MPAKPGETGLKVLLSSTLQPPVSLVQLSEVPPRGAELSDDSPENWPVSKQRDAEYDAFSGVDLELVDVIQAWAELRREREGRRACGDGQGCRQYPLAT
jgi:hypothetical protein